MANKHVPKCLPLTVGFYHTLAKSYYNSSVFFIRRMANARTRYLRDKYRREAVKYQHKASYAYGRAYKYRECL